MKKWLAFILIWLMAFSLSACEAGSGAEEGSDEGEITAEEDIPVEEETNAEETIEQIELDVIICQYGPNTKEWFLGTGMSGSNFEDKFHEANPDIKLNLEVIPRDDVHTEVDKRIAEGRVPDVLNIDVYANYASQELLLPAKDYCPDSLYNDFFPQLVEKSVIDGTVWAVPAAATERGESIGVMDRIMAFKDDSAPDPTARTEAIGTFLNFFYDPDNYAGWVSMEGFLPAVSSAAEELAESGESYNEELEALQEGLEEFTDE